MTQQQYHYFASNIAEWGRFEKRKDAEAFLHKCAKKYNWIKQYGHFGAHLLFIVKAPVNQGYRISAYYPVGVDCLLLSCADDNGRPFFTTPTIRQ